MRGGEERIRQALVVIYFKVLSRNSLVGDWGKHGNFHSGATGGIAPVETGTVWIQHSRVR